MDPGFAGPVEAPSLCCPFKLSLFGLETCQGAKPFHLTLGSRPEMPPTSFSRQKPVEAGEGVCAGRVGE